MIGDWIYGVLRVAYALGVMLLIFALTPWLIYWLITWVF